MNSALKYRIVEKIVQSNDEELLNEINALLGLSETDFWAELPVEIKKGIDRAKAELDNGDGMPHSQVIAEIRQRFPNR